MQMSILAGTGMRSGADMGEQFPHNTEMPIPLTETLKIGTPRQMMLSTLGLQRRIANGGSISVAARPKKGRQLDEAQTRKAIMHIDGLSSALVASAVARQTTPHLYPARRSLVH